MRLFNFLVGFVALGTAACAAFFSVIGIATFLGGNFIEVAVMASFLEAGKLICASAAYRFRKVAPIWIRGLLITFTVVMMFITSMGIFGFLSSGYQEAASERDVSEQRIENVQSKKESFESRVSRLEEDRERLIETKSQLDSTQAAQGWLSERQAERLSQIPSELNEIENNLSAARDSALAYQQKATNLESEVSAESKLGPILFVADAVGLPQNKAALYFICILIFVFDPMAVTLVVALSMATDFEETVEEEDGEEPDHIEEVGDEVDPQNEDNSASEVAEELSKPLPETEERINRMQRFASLDEESGDIRNSLRDKIPIEEVNKKVREMSEDILRERQDEISQNKLYEENNSRNKEGEEEVEDDPFYPEEPPELDVPEKQQDDGIDEEEFEEWIGGASESTDEKKPWKDPFKEPFNK